MRVFLVSVLAILSCLVSCTILIDTDTAQCSSDAECNALFPSRGLICLGSSCLPPPVEAGTDAPPAATCNNAQCMDQEAAATGGSAICVEGKCQPLKLLRKADGTLLCLDEVLPLNANSALRSDDVLVLGGFVPVRGGAPLSDRQALSYRLALEELRDFGGLDIGKSGGKRPVVMSLCASEPDLVEEGLAHLTQDLKVPVIVARFGDDVAADLVNRYALANEIFTMNPSPAPYALVEQASVGGLAWHLLGGSEDVAQAYGPFVKMLETVVRNRKGIQPATPMKVALLTTDFSFDDAIAEVIQHGPQTRADGGPIVRDASKGIHFNGNLSADENGTNFRVVRVKSKQRNPPPSEADYQASISAALTDLEGSPPDLIIAVTGAELNDLVEPLEEALYLAGGASALPQWALSVSNAALPGVRTHVKALYDTGGTTDADRFVGIQYAGSTLPAVREGWLTRMNKLYAGQQIDPATYAATENSYDAIYWIAYGLFKGTAPGTPVNGTALATGVRKLLPGTTDVYPGGTMELTAAVQAMRTQPNVRFVGALGPRDIDSRTGAIFGTGSVFCYQGPSQIGQPVTIQYDVLRYDATKGTLGPSDPPKTCFVGFPP